MIFRSSINCGNFASLRSLLFILVLIVANNVLAQSADSTTLSTIERLQISSYMEFYIAIDDDENQEHERPTFLYNNTRTGELALNIGLIKATWGNKNIRGNFALMTGTYADKNLSSESDIYHHLYEANVGLKLSKRKNWWLDIGVLNSHIGLETVIGNDNPTLSRSIAAENSPYYETGCRASYNSPNEKFYFAGLMLNGWQRISKLDGSFFPAFGIQATWKPNEKVVINYSNYMGDESDSTDFGLRHFHDLFFVYAPTKKLSITGAFDFGQQKNTYPTNDTLNLRVNHFNWYTWYAVVKWNISKKLSIASRTEYYNDKYEVLITNKHSDGFMTMGYSINVDYKIYPNALLRIEGRRFDSENAAFENLAGVERNKYDGVTVCLSVSL